MFGLFGKKFGFDGKKTVPDSQLSADFKKWFKRKLDIFADIRRTNPHLRRMYTQKELFEEYEKTTHLSPIR